MKNEDILEDSADGSLKGKTAKALKEKLSNKMDKSVLDNKGNFSYEELWAFAQDNNCTLKDAKKRITNK